MHNVYFESDRFILQCRCLPAEKQTADKRQNSLDHISPAVLTTHTTWNTMQYTLRLCIIYRGICTVVCFK
ncbi:hypothetical protein XENTR_v10014276 [Xenopus tropicalis]|nr:hypothetical protein XENTR_v10014276 [Xenopus tropicalis]